jgi:hypothetical protein
MKENPFGKYVPEDGKIGEPNSAGIADIAWNTCWTCSKDYIMLIGMYMDETVVSSTSIGTQAFPMTFTSCVFNLAVSTILCPIPRIVFCHNHH